MSYIYFDTVKFSSLIKNSGVNPQEIIEKSELYFAHTPPDNKAREKETLVSHMEKVKGVFLELIELHGLDNIVDNHIHELVSHNGIRNKQNFYEFLKLLFFEGIRFHDIGKLNENYQIEKMGLAEQFKKKDNSIASTHSNLSTFLFIAYMIEKLDMIQTDEEKGFAFIFILIFSMPVRKHHASNLTNPFYYFENSYEEEKNRFFETVDIKKLQNYLDILRIKCNKMFHNDIFYGQNLDEHYKKPFFSVFLEKIGSFPLYSLLKLNSSLLTISDYIATSRYMWDERLELGGTIKEELKKHIYDSFYSKEYNKKLNHNTPKELNSLATRSKDNLNELRFKLAHEVRGNLLKNKNIDKNLFFLEAPTGGGKTNMSFMLIAELLKGRPDLNKVFYVFPFTTLITQTLKSIKDTLGLQPNNYIELHSKTGFKENEEKDGEYGNKKINFIDYQFVNYPFTLLTHIKFFDIIKSHKKNDNYLYHKLSNSIVVIDELQAYSPEHWDKIYYFLKNISNLFNTIFIVMSATLPKIDKLKIAERLDFSEFIHLVKNKDNYFQNSNFANRVEFDLSMIAENQKISLDKIQSKLFEESEKYAINNERRCWTLIEFIFKNSAAEFFEAIKQEADSKGYEIKMLSGSILEPVRKKIINDLKTRDGNSEKSKIILVSTQVIEAGVDLDFDLGFKDTSILDSDEQLAGRINRNASKNGCRVFLFNFNDEYRVYGSDYRYRMQKQHLDTANYKNILKTKNFDDFYKDTFNFINNLNKSESRYGFFDYESLVSKLSYSAVRNEFKLIDQDTLSVFVNVEYDLEKYPIEHTLGLEKSGKIHGEDVFKKYCDIIENKDQDFISRKISLTEIQGLMSSFIFSTYKSNKMIEKLIFFSGEEQYGFWYISDLVNSSQKEIYTLEGGLNEKELGDVQFI
ncbi:MAG: CRISPR-associated helicase Cas3' [Deltaproteobacteria bacterium]|nr:CRISPR-associated helicase Cas3' [Deltaproteobacteria bacterium]